MDELPKLQTLGEQLTDMPTTDLPPLSHEPPGMFILFILTTVLVFIAWIIIEIGNYQEVRRNWTHYRCQPSVTPFAAFYGFDLKETLNFCIGQVVKDHAPEVVDPIYNAIQTVSNTADSAFGVVRKIEGGVKGLLKGFSDFVINFINSFRLLGTRVRMIFIRMKDIFARMYGVFISFAYAAISAITFGQNLICNPLVTFIGGIAGVDLCCFAPETRIHMAGGHSKEIQHIQIGDRLSDWGAVTAVFRFDGTDVEMVRLPEDVVVSGNHALRNSENGEWIAAADRTGSLPTESLPLIWCISTTTNIIPVTTRYKELIFTDYEESSDPEVAAAAQAAAESALQPAIPVGAPVADYGLGLDPEFCVQLWDGQWTKLSKINIGHRLASGAFVSGVVRELCNDVRITPKGWRVSAAQLLRLNGTGLWARADHMSLERSADSPQELCQIFTSTNDSFVVGWPLGTDQGEIWEVRDYQEWHGAETQDPYDKALGLTLDLVPSLNLKSKDSR